MLEKTLGGRVLWTAERSNQSILKEINPFDWFWHYSEAEAPILWPPDAKSWLTGKDSDAGKDWGQEDKGATVRWLDSNQQLSRHESEQTLGDSEGQGSLVCCSPWGCKELDTTEWVNSKVNFATQVLVGVSSVVKKRCIIAKRFLMLPSTNSLYFFNPPQTPTVPPILIYAMEFIAMNFMTISI